MGLVLGLGLFAGALWLLFLGSRALHARLQRRGLNRALTVGLLLGGLASLLGLAVADVARERLRESQLEGELPRLRAVLRALSEPGLGLLTSAQGGDHLLELLAGGTVPALPRLEHTPVALTDRGVLRYSVEGDLPFLPIDREIAAGERLVVPLPAKLRLARLAIALPRASDGAPRSLDIVVRGPGNATRRLELDVTSKSLHGWGDGDSAAEIQQIPLEPAAVEAAALELRARAGGARVLGICALDSEGNATALSPRDVTRSGLPIQLGAGPIGSGLRIEPGKPPVEVVLPAPIECDRLSFVFAVQDARAAEYRWFGEEAVELRLEYESGTLPEIVTLKHGEELHYGNLDRSRHGEDFASKVALAWQIDGARWHADERSTTLSQRRRLARIVARNLTGSAGYAVELLAVTASRFAPLVLPQPDHPVLAAEGTNISIRPSARPLAGGAFAAVVDARGRIVGALGERRRALLGVSVDADLLEKLQRQAEAPVRYGELGGLPAAVAGLPLAAGADLCGVVAFLPDPKRQIERERFLWGPLVVWTLAAPYLLVVVASSLARGERIRRKLAIALLSAAVLPTAALLLIVPIAFDRARRTSEEDRLRVEASSLEGQVEALRETATQEALSLLQTIREHPRFEPLVAHPERGDIEAAVRYILRGMRKGREEQLRSLVVDVRHTVGGKLISRRMDDSDPSFPAPKTEVTESGVYQFGDRLMLVGVARVADPALRARLAMVKPLALPEDLVRRCVITDLEGRKLAGDATLDAGGGAELREAIGRAVAGSPGSAVRASAGELGRVGVLRGPDGTVQFAHAVFSPRGSDEITLLGVTTSLTALIGLVAVLGAVAALGLARVLTAPLTEPVEALARNAERARRGLPTLPVDVHTSDELAVLADQFEGMSAELQRRIAHLGEIQRGMLSFADRLDRAAVASAAARFAKAATGADRVLLLLPQPGRSMWIGFDADGRSRAVRWTPLLRRFAEAEDWSLLCDDGPAPLAFLPEGERRWLGPCAAVLARDLRRERRGEGLLVWGFTRRPAAPQEEAARAVATTVSMALENSRLYERAIEDASTGALVPHLFRQHLDEALERARALGQRVLLMRARLPIPEGQAEAWGATEIQRIAARVRRWRRGVPALELGRTGPLELMGFAAVRADVDWVRWERAIRRALERRAGAMHISAASFPDHGASSELLLRSLDREGGASPDPSSEDLARFADVGLESLPKTPAMLELLRRALRLSSVDLPILIAGEPAVGKRWLAQRIHARRSGPDAPFVVLRPSQIVAGLEESELFGVERGAYSGATESRPGLLDQCNGGTLFLDSIDEAGPELQAKLLRVLQERKYKRLGGLEERSLQVRVISSCGPDMERVSVGAGFRQDLFFRLAGVVLHIPPLRERLPEIPALAEQILRKMNLPQPVRLSPKAIDLLVTHSWPGNLAELEAALAVAVQNSLGNNEIRPEHLEIRSVPVLPADPIGIAAGAIAHERLVERPRRRPSLAPPLGSSLGRSTEERQQRLLGLLKKGDRITTRQYVDLMKVSPRTGLRDLEDLVAKGRLRREGRKRGMSFRVLD
ncbi:MAG: sigma 54-interacting transcriptional regulator [Planctomycetes bacterium]|nr:sigma 54-interacting transcriptional regulator [Planctomycetota bacterium]